MERWQVKVVALFLIYITILFVTTIPVRVAHVFARHGARGRATLSAISCFSGGIFLAASLLDMAPEVRVLLSRAVLEPYHIGYPLPELVIGAGFFLILFMELGVMMCTKNCAKAEAEVGTKDSLAANAAEDLPLETAVRVEELVPNGGSALPKDTNNPPAIMDISLSLDDRTSIVPTEKKQEVPNHDPSHQHLTRSIILVLALSMDSLFEGMALGLKTTIQGVWNLLIAIVAHEIVISFGMGMQLVKHHPRRRVIIIALIYSLMTPLGGTIGAIAMETQDGSVAMDTANGILQGLTAGIFIYVTFFEILNAEFTEGVTVRRILMTFGGFAAMAALKTLGTNYDVEPFDDGNSNTTLFTQG